MSEFCGWAGSPRAPRFQSPRPFAQLTWKSIAFQWNIVAGKCMLVPWNYDIFCEIRNDFNWRLLSSRPLYNVQNMHVIRC